MRGSKQAKECGVLKLMIVSYKFIGERSLITLQIFLRHCVPIFSIHLYSKFPINRQSSQGRAARWLVGHVRKPLAMALHTATLVPWPGMFGFWRAPFWTQVIHPQRVWKGGAERVSGTWSRESGDSGDDFPNKRNLVAGIVLEPRRTPREIYIWAFKPRPMFCVTRKILFELRWPPISWNIPFSGILQVVVSRRALYTLHRVTNSSNVHLMIISYIFFPTGFSLIGPLNHLYPEFRLGAFFQSVQSQSCGHWDHGAGQIACTIASDATIAAQCQYSFSYEL